MGVREPAGGLFAEATVRTVGGLAAAEGACIDYLRGVNDASLTCMDVWSSFQQASLDAIVGFLSGVLQVSPSMPDTASLVGDSSHPGRLWEETTLEITASGVRLIPGIGSAGEPSGSNSQQVEDWASSALHSPAPPGIVLAHWYELLDE